METEIALTTDQQTTKVQNRRCTYLIPRNGSNTKTASEQTEQSQSCSRLADHANPSTGGSVQVHGGRHFDTRIGEVAPTWVYSGHEDQYAEVKPRWTRYGRFGVVPLKSFKRKRDVLMWLKLTLFILHRAQVKKWCFDFFFSLNKNDLRNSYNHVNICKSVSFGFTFSLSSFK